MFFYEKIVNPLKYYLFQSLSIITKQGAENMRYNKVEICGVNTSKLKVLSDEKKKELLCNQVSS